MSTESSTCASYHSGAAASWVRNGRVGARSNGYATGSLRLGASRTVFVTLVAGVILLLAGRAAVTVRDAELSDFRCFYEAGRLAATGEDPYDRATWAVAMRTESAGRPPCNETFAYPMWTAMAMAPLSVLPEPVALAAWESVLLACALSAVALLSRAWLMVGGSKLLLLLLLWSEPMFSAVANAQFGPVVLLAFALLIVSLERGRHRAGAAAWCLLLIKPHIALLALVGLPALRRSHRFATHVLVDVLLIALASLALRPTWPRDVVAEILGQQLAVDRDLGTLSALAMVLGLPSWVGVIAAVVALGLFMAALPRRVLRPRELVVALAIASFLITPYARQHDAVVFAVCWAAALAWAKLTDGRLRSVIVAAVIAIAFVMPWAVTVLSLLGVPLATHVFTTIATAAITAYALRAFGSSTPAVRRVDERHSIPA